MWRRVHPLWLAGENKGVLEDGWGSMVVIVGVFVLSGAMMSVVGGA